MRQWSKTKTIKKSNKRRKYAVQCREKKTLKFKNKQKIIKKGLIFTKSNLKKDK